MSIPNCFVDLVLLLDHIWCHQHIIVLWFLLVLGHRYCLSHPRLLSRLFVLLSCCVCLLLCIYHMLPDILQVGLLPVHSSLLLLHCHILLGFHMCMSSCFLYIVWWIFLLLLHLHIVELLYDLVLGYRCCLNHSIFLWLLCLYI